MFLGLALWIDPATRWSPKIIYVVCILGSIILVKKELYSFRMFRETTSGKYTQIPFKGHLSKKVR